jgi:endonuclease-3 related protein
MGKNLEKTRSLAFAAKDGAVTEQSNNGVYSMNAPEPLNIYTRLLSRYGDPHWWPGDTPFEIITGAVLTQNTAWSNAEKAIVNFAGKLSPQYVAALSPEALAQIIRPAGFFNQKARCILEITRWFKQYDYSAEVVGALPLERIRGELLLLRGVGRETADSILLYAFGFPSFVTDAYTMRLLERLPLAAGRDYEAVKSFFERGLPRDSALYNRFHALIVLNAKAHCRKKPLCAGCPLSDICAAASNVIMRGIK